MISTLVTFGKTRPLSAMASVTEHHDDHGTCSEEEHARGRAKGPQLRDEKGFCCLRPPEKIHAGLDVELYVPVVPLAPLEELHESSVQHPSFPTTRWLLHPRRVPVLSPADVAKHTEFTGGAAEHVKPSCAGIGDAEKPAWL